jgi:FkbM family methyltransferase
MIDRLFGNLKFKEAVATVWTTDGFRMKVEPSDWIGRHIYLSGEFDRSTYQVLSMFSVEGDTLLDIGANIGYVSACFLNNIPHSKVVAVEPQPSLLPLIRDNLEQFGGRSEILDCAISDQAGEAYLQVCFENKGATRIADRPSGDTVTVRALPASMLSTYEPNLIKIDVEGHELAVLSSLLPALKRKPRAIVFEDQSGTPTLKKLFAAFGYRTLAIKKRLTGLDLVDRAHGANDYIALPT